jgi:hypothetical protein
MDLRIYSSKARHMAGSGDLAGALLYLHPDPRAL